MKWIAALGVVMFAGCNLAPPEAHLVVPATVAKDQPFLADGRASRATLRPIARYRWQFGDGTAALITSGPVATHHYGLAGEYTVTLTVIDSEGNGASATASLTVTRDFPARDGGVPDGSVTRPDAATDAGGDPDAGIPDAGPPDVGPRDPILGSFTCDDIPELDPSQYLDVQDLSLGMPMPVFPESCWNAAPVHHLHYGVTIAPHAGLFVRANPLPNEPPPYVHVTDVCRAENGQASCNFLGTIWSGGATQYVPNASDVPLPAVIDVASSRVDNTGRFTLDVEEYPLEPNASCETAEELPPETTVHPGPGGGAGVCVFSEKPVVHYRITLPPMHELEAASGTVIGTTGDCATCAFALPVNDSVTTPRELVVTVEAGVPFAWRPRPLTPNATCETATRVTPDLPAVGDLLDTGGNPLSDCFGFERTLFYRVAIPPLQRARLVATSSVAGGDMGILMFILDGCENPFCGDTASCVCGELEHVVENFSDVEREITVVISANGAPLPDNVVGLRVTFF